MLSSCNQGQTGRRARQRGFGSQLTSMSGFTHLTGDGPGKPPVLLYGPYVDFVAVGFGLIAVLAALDYRRRTGTGQHIDLSQYEAGIQFIAPAVMDAQINGRVHEPEGNRDPHAAPHGVYPCKGEDEWCAIAVFNDEEWRAFCHAAERLEWVNDSRFMTAADRKAHEPELDPLIAEWSAHFEACAIMERLQSAGVCAGLVQSVPDLFSCPQLAHRHQWVKLPHAEFGTYEHLAPPFVLSETPSELRRSSPLLGEHNDYVFEHIVGLSPEEIQKLKDERVIA